jgi:flagellar hook-associated protein 3 FlgL
MQISTSQYFAQSASQMDTMQSAMMKTQEQLSTGQQLTQPSDSASQSSSIMNLNSELSVQSTYTANQTAANTSLTAASSALQSSSDLINSFNTLMVQAKSGTLNASERQTIGVQLQGITNQLESLAATKDANGNYIFSGSKITVAPFSQTNGQLTYQGDQSTLSVQIGNNMSVQASLPGNVAFPSVSNTDPTTGATTEVSFFQALQNMTDDVNNSDMTGISQGLTQLSTMTTGLNSALALVGTTQDTVTSQGNITSSQTLALQTALSKVQDTDYTTAVSQLSEEQVALQAAQETFSQVSKMSLFQYLGS